MKITDLIRQHVQQSPYFFGNRYAGVGEAENLRSLVLEFLDTEAAEEKKREFLAMLITRYALLPHTRGAEVGPAAGVLDAMEIFGKPDYESNRLQAVHQVNTYLLGLLFYDGVKRLRTIVDDSLDAVQPKSAGDNRGEFLFRWQLASLAHDIGFGITRYGNDAAKIKRYLFYLALVSNDDWGRHDGPTGMEALLHLERGKSALAMLDAIGGDHRLAAFYEQLYKGPVNGIYYDHGVVAALLLLKLMDRMYVRHDESVVEEFGHAVSFTRAFFDQSIVAAAYAIAVHSVDLFPDIYARIWGEQKVFDLNRQPLAFLLKLCDLLQQWYRGSLRDGGHPRPPDDVELVLSDEQIIVERFPKKENLRDMLQRYCAYGNLVHIAHV